jgi:hypothetical protein
LLPALAVEGSQLHLADRVVVVGPCVNFDAGQQHRQFEVLEVGGLAHDVFARQVVLAQFKAAIVEGRNMKPEVLDQYADGRVFTGSQAVKLGFADSVGTWDDARRTLGQMTGLGDNPEVFKVKKRNKLLEFFEASSTSETSNVSAVLRDLFQTELSARPLLLLPGAVQF